MAQPVITLKALTLDNVAVMAGENVNALLELERPAGTGSARVAITSSAPTIASVPETAVVLAGQNQVTFQIATATTTQTSVGVVITAKLNDATRQASLRVQVISVKVSPSETSLRVEEELTFTASVDATANQKVRWSVQPADGGTIQANGHYEAPNRTGRFTVVATSEADPTKKGVAAVEVKPRKFKDKEFKEFENPKQFNIDLMAELPVRDIWLGSCQPPLMGDSPSDAAGGRSFIRSNERPDVVGPNIVLELDGPR